VAAAPGRVATPVVKSLEDNVAAVVGYLTFIPAMVFLLTERYRRKRFVRFHSFQSIALSGVTFAAFFILTLSWLAAGIWGHMIWEVDGVIAVSCLVLVSAWLVCIIQAYRNKEVKLPLLGAFAEKYTGA
jgi:uncharacterized membrane protein